MPIFRTITALLALAAWPALAPAQTSASLCQVKDSSAKLVLMLCPQGATPESWRAAAQNACAARKDCNVWIWDNAADVPAKAPATDADLPKDRSAKAVAIWVQQSQDLVTLKRAGAGK